MAAREGSMKVACVGAGFWGMNLLRNFQDIGALYRVCEQDPGKREALHRLYPSISFTDSIDEILVDPQVKGVAVATPAETHGGIVQRALRARKDVFVEKPLCLSVEEGRELVSLASAQKCILMVGHLLWYHPAVLKLQDLIRQGEIGRVQYIYSSRLNLGRFRKEENILWSFAPHDVSVILGLVDEMPDEVFAKGGNYLHNRNADITVSYLSFPSGVKAHIFVSWLHPFKEQKLVVVGDRKMAVFDDMEKEDKLLLYPHSIDWKNHMPVANRADPYPVSFTRVEPLREECQHFLDCMQTRRPPRTNGEEGLRVLKVIQMCQESLESLPGNFKTASKGKRQTSYYVHESAFIDEGVQIGGGTAVWHVSHIREGSRIGKNCRIGQNVVIGPNVSVGNNVKIQNNVSVYEGVTIEDDVFCGPSIVFTNVINPRSNIPRMHEIKCTLVKRGSTLGANSTILCGITIGQYAFVAAGAVVTKDVLDYALVAGNPARIKGWMCECGSRLKVKSKKSICAACGKKYLMKDNRLLRV